MRTVLITGASSGLGKATSKLFHEKGFNVIATMRSPDKEKDLIQQSNTLVTRLDVQDDDSIRQAIQKGIDRFGAIDVLVNNAGYGLGGPFESATKDQITRQYSVNVFGLMDVTKAALPWLRKNGGTIINISSVGGIVAFPFASLYNSTKFAVEGFSEALSHELAPFNIAVKIVEPGSVATNFRQALEFTGSDIPDYTPLMGGFLQRFATATGHLPKATPDDVAATIFTAATDNKSRLRYIVGNDAQFYIGTKQQNTDEDFVSKIRTTLLPVEK
jgi:NAD(P)-dependent dehydrogenase (short-subunit alcohol dehydrogenase family)